MIIKHATQVGNPIIRQKAKAVANPCSKESKKIVKDLIDSMRYHELIGMAAPQIGKSARIFVVEIRETPARKNELMQNKKEGGVLVFINPKILSVSKKEVKGWEGCGSIAFANLFGMVKRPESVVVEAYDTKGNLFEMKASGLLARVIQHENDHLNGILFTDTADTRTYMSRDEYFKLQATKKKRKQGK